jgi:methylenetetrahydrofolate dehydrogenase (NADP+)/methenyltetrahydrofolate cyclohydrolase
MTAQVLDGKAVASTVRAEVKARVDALRARGVEPGLGVILVGDDPASQVYVRNKGRAAREVGIQAQERRLPASSTTTDVVNAVSAWAGDNAVQGILVQMPQPPQVDGSAVLAAIPAHKDVDGLSLEQQGRLLRGEPGLWPCTPAGVVRLLHHAQVRVEGAEAVVVGRSLLVGKPLALLLTRHDATVTVCHSRTRDLEAQVGRADILVAALGRPELVKGAWVKPGATVIDVGINRLEDGRLVGDVEFGAAAARARVITPVPGGVGPMTIAYLLHNTAEAAAAPSESRHPQTRA